MCIFLYFCARLNIDGDGRKGRSDLIATENSSTKLTEENLHTRHPTKRTTEKYEEKTWNSNNEAQKVIITM